MRLRCFNGLLGRYRGAKSSLADEDSDVLASLTKTRIFNSRAQDLVFGGLMWLWVRPRTASNETWSGSTSFSG